MKIQNAPLAHEQLARINRLVIDMGNKMACCRTTGISVQTLDSIMKRGWASTRHINALMDYCNSVENFSPNKTAA